MSAPFGRIGLAGAANSHKKRSLVARDCNLANGDLYTAPTAGQVINGTQPLEIQWNTACTMDASTVDIYLYDASGVIKEFGGKTFTAGSLTIDLEPKWWNSTETASLYFTIVSTADSDEVWAAKPGPVFTVDYPLSAMVSTTVVGGSTLTSTVAAAATQSQDAVFQNVSSTNSSHKIAKGAIAAAVIVPLLVVALIIVVAIRFYRMKEDEKRKRWSKAISSHSNLDWREGAHSGEKPASIFGRPSFQSGGGGNRTSSVFAVEGNMAGAGTGMGRPSINDVRSQSATDVSTPQMQMRYNAPMSRSSVALNADGGVRTSRISFAETARPDRRSRLSLGESLRPQSTASGLFKHSGGNRSANDLVTPNRKSMAYATGSAIDDDDDDINISPSQLQGPHGFGDAEMRRVGGGKRTGRRSMMSLGGDKSRRGSTASALSTDDFKSAASARGSVDELRDMEAVMLMRRSIMSQHSGRSPQMSNGELMPASPAIPDTNDMEALGVPLSPPMPSAPSPVAGSSTVAYGPDHLLAVYAARVKEKSQLPLLGTPSAGPIEPPKSAAMRGMASSSAAPITMKSFVHLNQATVARENIDSLPAPGRNRSLRIPVPGQKRDSSNSEASKYSEGEDGSHAV
ncbi:hypothetical protein P7C73_g6058, partial [Tremellales sp. Uapishka_1]